MSIIKIDMNSDEFQAELEKTVKFTDKVITQFGWSYNPQEEINEGVQLGLARNKMLCSCTKSILTALSLPHCSK